MVQSGKKIKVFLKVMLTWGFVAAMLRWPESVFYAAQQAMTQWYANVAPALLPFIMLMPLLTCREAMEIYEWMLGRIMRILFDLPGAAAPAMVIGMVAGSPAGVMAAGNIAENAGLERRQLLRIAVGSCGLSPAFLVSGIGVGMMGSVQLGQRLLMVQGLSQLVLLMGSRWLKGGGKISTGNLSQEVPGVHRAILGVLSVAAYMVLFGVIICVIQKIVGESYGGYLAYALEISMGALKIAGLNLNNNGKMMALAGMCGFGGICICVQNMRILSHYGISLGEYLAGKGISAIISISIMVVLTRLKIEPMCETGGFPPQWITFFAIILAVPALKMLKKSIS